MDFIIIIGLIVLGTLFFLIEVFLLPGISVAGFAALCSMGYACYYAFTELGAAEGYLTLAAVIVLCTAALILFMKSRTLDKLSLKKEIKSSVDNKVERSLKIGDKGTTVTRLALIGMADFGNRTAEVKSIDGFINEQTPIVVVRIEDGTILVKKSN